MKKHIFFDFNGTLINDLDLCIELLNDILTMQGKKNLSKDEYKNVFKFPIKQYYIDAGVDLNMNSFEELAVDFINKYQPASLLCGLFDGVYETIEYLKSKGIKVYILSASERNNLLEQCRHYGIDKIFDEILGIDNIHASSKLDIALEFMREANINPAEALFIGDTLHDYEVSSHMGIDCYLVSCGHQSVSILSEAGVEILDDINGLRGKF